MPFLPLPSKCHYRHSNYFYCCCCAMPTLRLLHKNEQQNPQLNYPQDALDLALAAIQSCCRMRERGIEGVRRKPGCPNPSVSASIMHQERYTGTTLQISQEFGLCISVMPGSRGRFCLQQSR